MRQYCSVCQYPIKTCVCNAVERVDAPVRLSIVQHPREAKHAKNTARLVALCIEHTELVLSNNDEQLKALELRCQSTPSAVLYPCSESNTWEHHSNSAPRNSLKHIVVLDGSWRQAFGMWQQHSWLRTLPAYHFTEAPGSNYQIRHTDDAAHLSTLEAVAYALKSGFGTNVAPLYQLQETMQKLWQGPAAHRR